MTHPEEPNAARSSPTWSAVSWRGCLAAVNYSGYRPTPRQTTWPLSVLGSGALLIPLMGWSDPGYAAPCQDPIALQAIDYADWIEGFPRGNSRDNLGGTKETTAKPSTSLLPFEYLAAAAQPSPELSPNCENAMLPWPTQSDDSESAMSSQAADRYPVSTGLAATSLAGDAPISATAPTLAQNSSGEPPPSVWERSTLTGDWGGLRSQLADSGVTFDLYFTQFLQGAVISSGSREFNYGGRFDALINFDTEKLGLWEGGSFNTHLELRYGSIPPLPTAQGAFWPVNTGAALPLGDSGNLVASSLYLSQRLGDVSLLIGKINVLDLLARDPFFGGWGTQRFMNLSFVAPPSGVLPPTIFGAITNIRLDPVTLTFMVYDPNDQTNNYWPNNLFEDGVTFSAGATYATTISNRPTTVSLTGTYSTQAGPDLNDILLPPDIEGGTQQGSYAIAFQFSHLLQQLPDNPREGWGIYFRGLLADGNPNPIQGSVVTGIGGRGLFATRPQDRFGLGVFYWNFSDELQSTINPILDFGNGSGLEAYYSYAITPWFHLTGDVQYINPANQGFSDALFLGLRAGLRF